MTVSATTRDREQGKLLVTDAELLRRLGVEKAILNRGTETFLCANAFEIARNSQPFHELRF